LRSFSFKFHFSNTVKPEKTTTTQLITVTPCLQLGSVPNFYSIKVPLNNDHLTTTVIHFSIQRFRRFELAFQKGYYHKWRHSIQVFITKAQSKCQLERVNILNGQSQLFCNRHIAFLKRNLNRGLLLDIRISLNILVISNRINKLKGKEIQFRSRRIHNRVCHGSWLLKRDDYFWVTIDHFWSEHHFFETTGQ